MKEKYFEDNLYYQFDNIDEDKVGHLFSSRIGWEDENKLLNNIFNNKNSIVSLKQIHGNHVEVVDESFIKKYDGDKLIEGDGLLTDLDNIVLKTYHADCTPLYFIDYSKNVIGVAHAGWKGTYENIMKSMIDKILLEYDSNLKDIRVFIGPAIKSCCYEVGEDLYRKFKNSYGEYSDAFVERNSKYYLDTQRINYGQALSLGIVRENISVTDLCTSCNVDRLYSYRRENGTKGRLITAITNRG